MQQGEGRFKGARMGLISIFSSHPPLLGLEAPQDLEAKEVTPRTALLTWTEPQVPPTNYLLSFNTPGEQTQVPPPPPSLASSPPRFHSRRCCPSSASPGGAPHPLTCSLCVHRRSCSQDGSPLTGSWASFPPPPTACGSGRCGARASHRLCPPPSPPVFGNGTSRQGLSGQRGARVWEKDPPLILLPQVDFRSPSLGIVGRRYRTEPAPPGPPPSSSMATASGP